MRQEHGQTPQRLLTRLGDYWLAVLIVVPFTTVFWVAIGAAVLYLTGISLSWIESSVLVACVAFLAWFAASMVAGPIADRQKGSARNVVGD